MKFDTCLWVFLCLLWPFSFRRRTALSDPASLNEIQDLPIPVLVPLVVIQVLSGSAPFPTRKAVDCGILQKAPLIVSLSHDPPVVGAGARLT